MAGRPVGTAYAELSLDATKLETGLAKAHERLVEGTEKIENAYKILGTHSATVFDQMRQNVLAASNGILATVGDNAKERLRVEQATAQKITQINEQQYGRQTSLVNDLRDTLNSVHPGFAQLVTVTGALAAAVGGLGIAAKTSLAYFKDLSFQVRDLAYLSGGTAEQVSGLVDTLDDFGVESGTVERAMVFLSRAVQEGSPALDRLGVSIRNNTGHLKTGHDIFYEVIDALRNTRSETERNAIAQELFSRGWTSMVPIIERGARALREAAANSKLLISAEDIKRADDYRKAMADLGDTLDRVKLAIGAGLLPLVSKLTQGFVDATTRALEFRNAAEMMRKSGVLGPGAVQTIAEMSGDYMDVGTKFGPRKTGTPEGLTPGEIKANEERKKQAEALQKELLARHKELQKMADDAAKEELRLIAEAERKRKESNDEITRNYYESVTKQQAIIVEAQKFGVQFTLDEAKRVADELEKLEKQAEDRRDAADQLRRDQAAQQIKDMERLLELQKAYNEAKNEEYEKVFANLFGVANQIGGEAGKGLGEFAAGFKGTTDIASGKDEWSKKYQQAEEYYRLVNELNTQGFASDEDVLAAHLARQDAQQRMYYNNVIGYAQNAAQMGAGAMMYLYNVTGQKHKELFTAYKAMKIAETLISTYSGAMKAYESLASIPYVGPILGAAAAAVVTAFGMAQVAAIASMQPGGGAAASPSPSGGGGYSYVQPTEPRYQKEEGPRPMAVNVHVYGSYIGDKDTFAREISDSLRKAWEDGA